MRRVLIRRPGGHAALELVSEPDPSPGPGQVRVQVKAAGVNYADCIVRMGYYEAAKGLYPITPGFEFAGVISALGEGAAGFTVGQRVLGISRFGAYASVLCVSPERLWPCPESWTFEQAAAFPAVFLTAHHGLFKAAKVEAGETVLVHSAAGGAGGALLQLARVKGCRVVAVVGASHKSALCRELGADAVIDRSSMDLWGEARRLSPQGYDAIFDSSGLTLKAGFAQLARGGRLVVYGFADLLPRGCDRPNLAKLAWSWLRLPRFSPLDMTASNRGVIGFNVVFLFDRLDWARRAMDDLFGWAAEGRLRHPPVTAFACEDAAKAHAALESGRTTGKLVLVF